MLAGCELKKTEHCLNMQFAAELPITVKMWLSFFIYKIAREDYHYTISEINGVAESTVCRIQTNEQTNKHIYIYR